MAINLAEAVKLKSILRTKLNDLLMELERVAFIITIDNTTSTATSNRSVVEVEQEIAQVRLDMRTLDRLVYAANINNTVSYNNTEIPLVEAIELASQLRAETDHCKHFGTYEKQEIEPNYGDSTVFYKIAQFDPADYRQRANDLERQAHRLSNAINAKNYSITIAFDDSKYF